MQANFVLDSNELDYSFIDKLKVLFQNKRVELLISESDDTKHLTKSDANKEALLASIANIENNENLVMADMSLFKWSKSLLKAYLLPTLPIGQ